MDVAVGSDANATAPAAFIELKWGSGTLYNCVWDVAKMAVAVAGGYAPRAYLVAGAPTTDWEGGAEGSELFTTDAWPTKYLLENYAHRWRFWRSDVQTRPVSLPVEVRTEALESTEMTIGGAPWTLRCAEVTAATDTAWIDVPTNCEPAV